VRAVHPALEAANAKRDRAREHVESLEDEADEFLGGYPYRVEVVSNPDPEVTWHTAKLKIVKEPPPRLSVLVGEVAYECISALNHLVWELATRKLGKRKVVKLKRVIQFPVSKSPVHFADQPLVKKRLVSAPALAKIERLQLYRGMRGLAGSINAPLGWAKLIADADKHRILAGRIGELRFDEVGWDWDETRASGPIIRNMLPAEGGPLKDGAYVSRIRFARGHAEAAVYMDRQPGADILFDAEGEMLRVENVEAIWTWLDKIALPTLTPLFPV
jgi:hypothetical protein